MPTKPYDPRSNPMAPNETFGTGEKTAATKSASMRKTAESNNALFGKDILPSMKLPKSQKKNEMIMPIENKNPLASNRGIAEFGMKKSGNKNNVAKNEKKDILFKIALFLSASMYVNYIKTTPYNQ